MIFSLHIFAEWIKCIKIFLFIWFDSRENKNIIYLIGFKDICLKDIVMGHGNERTENIVANRVMMLDYINGKKLPKHGKWLGRILIVIFAASGLMIFSYLMHEIQEFVAIDVLIYAVICLLFEILALVMYWIYRSTYERIYDKHYNNEQLVLLYLMASQTENPEEMYARIIDSEIKNRAQIAYNQRKQSQIE